MQKALLLKLTLIAGLTLLLTVPLGLVEDVVDGRTAYRTHARADIVRSWTGRQQVIGPLLVLPYRETLQREAWDDKLQKKRSWEEHRDHKLVVLPESLQVDGQVQTEERRRGLYTVPVYTADLQLNGRFTNRQARELEQTAESEVTWGSPYVSVLIADLRGVIQQPQLDWDGSAKRFESGSQLAGTGMHSPLPALDLSQEQEFSFGFGFKLRGMETLAFAPLGRDTLVQLDSPWPHPSFSGRYLPSAYQVSTDGFQAQWQASSFSSGMADMARQCAKGDCAPMVSNTFGVTLMNSVDIYQQADRSLKYGLLFLTLTFAFFFFYEVLKRLPVHPVQYLLVGLALSVFFLLLVSLSEHLAFGAAYAVAAGACSSLLGTYVGAILRSPKAGTLFLGVMLLLYGLLYFILQSEDNALLMGSLLLFSVLAGAMFATRKVDWYRVGNGTAEPPRVATGNG